MAGWRIGNSIGTAASVRGWWRLRRCGLMSATVSRIAVAEPWRARLQLAETNPTDTLLGAPLRNTVSPIRDGRENAARMLGRASPRGLLSAAAVEAARVKRTQRSLPLRSPAAGARECARSAPGAGGRRSQEVEQSPRLLPGARADKQGSAYLLTWMLVPPPGPPPTWAPPLAFSTTSLTHSASSPR
jgi:hypothetical protein